jgi:hypothetical protein
MSRIIADKLSRKGSFGLGGTTKNIIDADKAVVNGWYAGGGGSGINFFGDILGEYGTLFVATRQDNQIFQTNARSGRSGTRYSGDTGATWTDWEEVFTTENLQNEKTYGVGTIQKMKNLSGANIAANAIVSGSQLRTYYIDSGGSHNQWVIPTGSWKNVAGAGLGSLNGAEFVRVS